MRSTRGLKSKVLFGAACSVVILVSGMVFFPRAILFRISQLSPTIGYAVAHVYIQQLPLNEQHGAAHGVGTILYAAQKEEAMHVCDESFSYGCFHAVLISMFADKGVSVLSKMSNFCREESDDFGACQHGIGHALVASSGYDETSLQKALDLCRNNNGIFTGCFSGIFMEYNHRTSWGSAAETRVFLPNKPYAPCADYDGVVRQACIYSLPEWWWRDLQTKQEMSIFQALGNNCRHTCEVIGHCDVCFRGIGSFLPELSNFDPVIARENCAKVGVQKEVLWCTEIAAHYINRSAPIEVGLRACEKLDSSDKVECERWARQEEMLFRVYKPVL